MLTLTAAQHFYSSVPAAQSPVNRRGYQTVAATPGLPADAVAAIEDRSQYATAAGDPLKWQFYALPGGRRPPALVRRSPPTRRRNVHSRSAPGPWEIYRKLMVS